MEADFPIAGSRCSVLGGGRCRRLWAAMLALGGMAGEGTSRGAVEGGLWRAAGSGANVFPRGPASRPFRRSRSFGAASAGESDAVGSGWSLVFERLLVASWDAPVRVLG